MARLTKEELGDLIRETTIPLIKEHAGPQVAEVVKEAVAAEVARATKQPEYISGLVSDGGTHAPRVERVGTDKALSFGAYCLALAAGRNDKEKAIRAAKTWGRMDVAAALEKSVEKAMSAGDPTGGGFLVPPEFSQDVIELLRASGVVRSLNPMTMPMPSGSVKVPRITSGVSAGYIGENANATKSEVATGQLTLTFKKLAALVPISNDLLRYSSPSADTIVRDDAVRNIAAREDLAFIRGDGLSGTPTGLKNLINGANKLNANATASLAQTTIELGSLLQYIMDANITLIIQQGATGGVDVRPGWIFAPRTWRYLTTLQTTTGAYAFREEMMRGMLWGFPYRVTTQVPNDTAGDGTNYSEIYFGAFAHAVIGEALGLTVDASQEAAYYDGSSVVAAFSQDQTVIRVLAEHDFALRHDKAFAMLEQVTWGA